MSLAFLADGVENPENLARLHDAAQLLGASCSSSVVGRLIAIENARGASSVYGRRPLVEQATLAVGNERRGLSSRVLAEADETVAIPTESRTVTTLNVAAAAAVAGWYVKRGSGPQSKSMRPEQRRPALLIVGDDHVEVGSTLRSAAAFGFRDVLLEDRGAGWFAGSASVRREAFAAARRHKNALRVHRATIAIAARFEEFVAILPSGGAAPIHRERLARGPQQLVIVGAHETELGRLDQDRLRVASLGLQPVVGPPLRLVASITLAEIARQVGRRKPMPGRPAPRAPVYKAAIPLGPGEEDALVVEAAHLLEY